MSKPFDKEEEDFESLKIDDEFENIWDDGQEDDFVDIRLDGEPEEEEEPPRETVQASGRPVRKIEKVIQDPFAEDPEDEEEEPVRPESRGVSRGGKGGGPFSGRKSYLILIVICLLVIAAVVVALKFMGGKESQGESSAESTPASTEAAVSPWTENGNEAVTQLVNQYYTALKAADMTALQNVLDASALLDQETVNQMNSYIEDYQNLVCYTAPGEAEGEYAVYIVYDAKFRGIETLAPGMTPAYVVTDSAGALRLMTVEAFDERVYDYMLTISADETIQNLEADVEARYNQALASDAALNALVNPDGTQPAGEGTTASAGETAAPTESAAETAAPTESAAETAAPTESAAETAAPTESAAETTAAPAEGGEDTYTESTTGMVFRNTDTIMYATDDVRARTAPTTEGDEFDLVEAGTRIHVIGQSDTWSRVYLPEGDGTPRYIRSDLLTSQEPAAE